MRHWIYCGAMTAAFGFTVVGCSPVDTTKPCSGENCISDRDITHNIEMDISSRAELTGWTINVQTIHGVVYLHGLVDTSPQKELVESIARETRGVKGVENSIELRNFR